MARLWTTGAELDLPITNGVEGATAWTGSAPITRDTGTKRSGAASYKIDSTASNFFGTFSGGNIPRAAKTIYARAYFLFSAAPASVSEIIGINSGSDVAIRLRSGGDLVLMINGVNQNPASAVAIGDGQWHRLELSATMNASAQWTAAEARLDGVTIATWTGTLALTGSGNVPVVFGWFLGPGVNQVCYVDDVAVNDSAGGSNNSWPGPGTVIAMLPISDNARNQWTAGAGGTSNLFQGVNNTPPTGKEDGTAVDGDQIRNKQSATLPTSCDLNLDTYLSAGVPGGSRISAIELHVEHGEGASATGTKAGTAEVVSNPASGTVSFNFGGDAGLQGAYTSATVNNWRCAIKPVDTPAPTLSTAPVVRVTCVSGSTTARAACCCAMALYVDYVPPLLKPIRSPSAAAAFTPAPAGVYV